LLFFTRRIGRCGSYTSAAAKIKAYLPQLI
jgi:hypothetical protein